MKTGLHRIPMKAAAIAAALSMAASAVQPLPVYAVSEVGVPSDGTSTTQLVDGRFTVTEDDLAGMGYGPKVSVPVSVSLAFGSGAEGYFGSGEVYAYGIIGSGKHVSVEVNGAHEKYGKVYDASGQDCTRTAPGGFTGTLSKTGWSSADCYGNLKEVLGGQNASGTGTLSVGVAKEAFLPRGTGAYTTSIPLVITMGED